MHRTTSGLLWRHIFAKGQIYIYEYPTYTVRKYLRAKTSLSRTANAPYHVVRHVVYLNHLSVTRGILKYFNIFMEVVVQKIIQFYSFDIIKVCQVWKRWVPMLIRNLIYGTNFLNVYIHC